MKNPVKLLCLVGALLLLLGAYYLVTREEESSSTSTQTSSTSESVSVFAADSDAVTLLCWTWEGVTYTLEKTEDGWQCAEGYPIDETTVEKMASTASAVVAERTVSLEDSTLADFQLDDPVMTVTVATESVSATVILGLRNPYTDQNYAMLDGQDTVYLLDTDLYSTFSTSLLELVELESLEDYSTTRTLTIETEAGTLVLVHPEDTEGMSYVDSFTWFMLDEDGNYTAMDSTNTASLAATISACNWVDCVDYQPDSLADYGLDAPLATVTIEYELSDGDENATAVLLIGAVAEYEELAEEEEEADIIVDSSEADSDLAALLADLAELLPEEDGDGTADAHAEAETADSDEPAALYYYAKFADGDLIYRLSATTVEKILSASAESLLPDEICLIDWDTLTAMTFTINGQEHQFLIRRVEDADDSGNVTTTVVCTYNGQEVETSSVKAILTAIKGLDQEATASEAVSAEAEISIRFSRDRDTYSVMTLTLTPYDLNFYVVSFNGRSDQLVSIRDVASLVELVEAFAEES